MTLTNILSHGEDQREDHIMLMDIEKNCYTCKHFHDDQSTCDAFPDGIPTVFLYEDETHDRPYPGDKGIQFEPIHNSSH